MVRRAVSGRVLAACPAQGGWVIGTRTELVLVDAEGGVDLRLPWQQVQSAQWDAESGCLRVSEVGSFGKARARHVLWITEHKRLLELVRERVSASVVLQRRTAVEG